MIGKVRHHSQTSPAANCARLVLELERQALELMAERLLALTDNYRHRPRSEKRSTCQKHRHDNATIRLRTRFLRDGQGAAILVPRRSWSIEEPCNECAPRQKRHRHRETTAA